MTNIAIVGGGISGMVASINIKNKLKDSNVYLIEKEEHLGGRLYQENHKTYTINNGPSWYWMDDIISNVFNDLNITKSYNLMKPKNQYKIVFDDNSEIDVPNDANELRNIIKQLDPTCLSKYDDFMESNKLKYELCKSKFLYYNHLSITEYISLKLPYYLYILDVFSSYKTIINSISPHPKVRTILEWPSYFIGSNPSNISGLFTFLTYSMIKHGTSIPSKNGMIELIHTLEKKIDTLGIIVLKNHNLLGVNVDKNTITSIKLNTKKINIDKIIAACDYHFMESLLPTNLISYPKLYWDNLSFCPSALIFNIILNVKFPNILFHNLFFNGSGTIDDQINNSILCDNPFFYINVTSKFFSDVPDSHENLFILIPTKIGIEIDEAKIKTIFNNIISRLSNHSSIQLKKHIVASKNYNGKNFKQQFNAYGGNAYGLGLDGLQIGFMRPKIKSHKITNLYYCGQITNPGPGIPPCMISGLLTSNLLIDDLNKKYYWWKLEEFWIYITHLISLLFTTKSFKCVWDYL